MSALTEKLGLTVYDDADNPTVKSWRDTINKNAVQSAFSIIDAYAIATDARITTVEQSRKLFRISATEEVANIYLATAPEIESLSNGVQIQVSFDATNTGAATININSTGAKPLKKISLSGITIDIEPNDIIANKIYTFEYYDNVFIKVGGFSSSEIIMTEGSQDSLLQIGIGGKIQESPVALYNGKISGDGINIGNMLTVENNNIELPTFAETIPGTYLGLTVDAYGRITSTDTPVPNSSGAFVLNSVDGALSWSTKAPDSDKLDGVDSTGYMKIDGWIPVSDTWTRASATTITVPSGAASKYKVGQGIRLTQSGTVKYFYIVGVANTLLTITGGSDYTLTSVAISAISYTNMPGMAIGFPATFNLPAPTWITTGTEFTNPPTTTTTKFNLIGNRVFINFSVGLADISGGTGAFVATFSSLCPLSIASEVGSALNISTFAPAGFSHIGSDSRSFIFGKYDGSTLAESNEYFTASISYFI